MKIEDLEKELKTGELRGLYLLYGEETFLLENCLKSIKKLFGEMINGINYILIDDTNINEIISDLETPAFGYEKKLIIAKNTGLFNKDLKKKSKNDNSNLKEKLNTYIKENLEQINETVVLVFVEETAEKCELLSTIEKQGAVCNFEYQKPIQIQSRLKGIINAYKVDVEMATLNYLIECCGTDMQELINETRKLIEFTGEGNTITKEAIDKLAIKKMESIIFDLTDSLGKKNTKQAIEVLRNLILSKEPLQKILITLYNHFKKIYLTKLAIAQNKAVTSYLDLKPNQAFLANKYKAQASYFKLKELRRILQEFCDLDYKYKIGLIDLNVGLEAILCAYC
ncbi:MAG: DNA polymerase III subunit delta [Clostridia bacterium]|nr:DNA polymerase III subunit delta [Clostridia bacterium]